MVVEAISDLIFFRDLGIRPRKEAFWENGSRVPQICLIFKLGEMPFSETLLKARQQGQRLAYFTLMTP